MPRAKRNKEVTLSKVKPKGKDHKENQYSRLQAAAQSHPYCYLFSVGSMRNNHLKQVREYWKGSSIFWGMNGVARKALGIDQDEITQGISEVTKRLQGPVGLLFTSSPPSVTLPWFSSFSASSYLRSGQISPQTITLKAGPVQTAPKEWGGLSDDLETLPHSLEPQLRKLGLPTELKMGTPTLLRDFDLVKKGKLVTTENAQILKHIQLPLSTFKIIPICLYKNPNLTSKSENQDPDSKFSSTHPSMKDSTSLNDETLLLKLSKEDEVAVRESMKGVEVGRKVKVADGNGKGRAERRKTRKEALESNLKNDVVMDEDEDDEEDEDDDDDEEMDGMDGDAVGASMMLPESMKAV